MARGYPDYFGFSMFPFYGTVIKGSLATGIVASGVTLTIITISKKGRISGGSLLLGGTHVLTAGKIKIYIDDNLIAEKVPHNLYDYSELAGGFTPLFLQQYDQEEPQASIGFTKDFCFGHEWRLTFENSSPLNMIVAGEVYYTLYQ